ncbi:MAG: hypothetical protein R2741_02490 [Methanolobus sp.]
MKFYELLFSLFTILILVSITLGCIDDSTNGNAESESGIVPETSFSVRADGKPIAEYIVPVAYSSDYDEWMANTAEENRKYVRDELHLFTFADGKQFEYYLKDPDVAVDSFLVESEWTEEPDESLSPTPITREEFESDLEKILSEYNGAYYEWHNNVDFGEILYIYSGEPLALYSTSLQATILKEYVDSNPDKDEYVIGFEIPMATENTVTITALYFSPSDYTIMRDESLFVSDTKISAVITTCSDATYTSIVKAIDTGIYVNHPAKYWVTYE